MAPTSRSGMAIVVRDDGMSSGDIAGAVVGSVLGGSLLLIILGFLYFRHRRMTRQAQAEDPEPIPKASFSQHGTLFPWQAIPPGQQPPTQDHGRPFSVKDGRDDQAFPVYGETADHQQSPTSPRGDDWMKDNEGFYTHQASGLDSLPQDIDFSMPAPSRQPTGPLATEHGTILPVDDASTVPPAANSSYYDTNISMESIQIQTYTPPSRQMTDLYNAQRQAAEEYRKRSGSLPRRIWNSIKRKRSTQSSSQGPGNAQSPTSQQYFPTSPLESPINVKQEPGSETSKGIDWQTQGATNRFFEEPEEIGEASGQPSLSEAQMGMLGSGPRPEQRQQPKRQKQSAGDSRYGDFPFRIDTEIRETTERDAELPSAVLRTEATSGLPPATQPHPPDQAHRRLKSPDIPEPMDIDTQSGAHDQSPFRGSHSPPLAHESFVMPMAVMKPTNAVEQAAFTDYQMENSASPPPMAHSPPQIVTRQPTQVGQVDLPTTDEHAFADTYLNLPPDDDEPRLSSESYEYSTTPGQSSTDPSSGRTPDTRITASPSPFPTVLEHVKVEQEPSASPESSRLSPQSPPNLTCEECGRSFDQIHKLNHHKRYHDRKHECPHQGCDKKFGTKTHLDRHINDKHVKSKAYHCTEPTCPYFKGGKAFPRKDNWRRHMVKKHAAGTQQLQELEAMDEPHG
ncbi:Uu.00g112430.m01.CDS01 [Anthostomella pinea]|uniref:C2H2 type master regulator of conidiophore development brlA n=1 Tax=Anthostomella pinea TaxID=933095 RepID=A0AAI8VGC0_9PEZI|nr:Uu.00g112430.m01.CDS01 [Anthostomella pinea]